MQVRVVKARNNHTSIGNSMKVDMINTKESKRPNTVISNENVLIGKHEFEDRNGDGNSAVRIGTSAT